VPELVRLAPPSAEAVVRSATAPQLGVIAPTPKTFTAWSMLKARIESAASAFTAFSPLVRNLPPPDIRLVVPNGCSTVHRRIVIRLGSAWIRASNRSRAL
jgi:hypothetical protein